MNDLPPKNKGPRRVLFDCFEHRGSTNISKKSPVQTPPVWRLPIRNQAELMVDFGDRDAKKCKSCVCINSMCIIITLHSKTL